MTGRITSTFTIGGVNFYSSKSREDEGVGVIEIPLPAAQAGTLTTRTDDNTGVVTLAEGHDIVTGKVDVFWSGGCRYGMDAVVTVNACAIDLGAGDVLPADETAVTIANQVSSTLALVGNDLLFLAVLSNKRAHADIQDSGGSSLLALDLVSGEAYDWVSENGWTNPLAGDTAASIKASNAETAAATLKIGVIYSTVV